MQGFLLGHLSSCYCCCPKEFSTGLVPWPPGFLLSPMILDASWLEGATGVPDCAKRSLLVGLGHTTFDGNALCCNCRKFEDVA